MTGKGDLVLPCVDGVGLTPPAKLFVTLLFTLVFTVSGKDCRLELLELSRLGLRLLPVLWRLGDTTSLGNEPGMAVCS